MSGKKLKLISSVKNQFFWLPLNFLEQSKNKGKSVHFWLMEKGKRNSHSMMVEWLFDILCVPFGVVLLHEEALAIADDYALIVVTNSLSGDVVYVSILNISLDVVDASHWRVVGS